MTHAEKQALLKYKPGLFGKGKVVADSDATLPASVNWVTAGAVNGPEQEGNSSFAAAVTGGIDGADFIKNGKLRKFSEHQLLDCSEKKDSYDYYENHFAILTKD